MFCVFCVRFSARKTHKTCTKTIKRCRQSLCLSLHWHKHLLDPCSTTCYTLHAKASFLHNRLRRCRRRSLLPGSGVSPVILFPVLAAAGSQYESDIEEGIIPHGTHPHPPGRNPGCRRVRRPTLPHL